jgi:serine/threonine-protein kinase
MDQPSTVTRAPEPVATVDHPRAGSAERLRVALVGAAATAGTGELTQQLRRRLRFFAALAAAALAVHLLILVFLLGPQFFAVLFSFGPLSRFLLVEILLLVCETGAALYLRPRHTHTLRKLRVLELAVFAPVAAFFVFDDVHTFTHLPDEHYFIGPLLANGTTLPFAIVLLAYGVLIPNTWRRCAAAVGLLAALAYVGPAVGFTLNPQPVLAVLFLLFQTTLWLAVAACIAVYGAYRIEVLRVQAERGRELGQYRLGRSLGAGGMGEVFLAEHRLLRRPCAIKLIRPERAGDPATLARFEREVRATATLTHPNTVQVFDCGRAEDGTFYCVMEYLPGLTLEQFVKKHGPPPPARAIHFLRQVCGALREAHAIGLIHRDVKPGNVIVCERGGMPDVIKLLDFGLARPGVGAGDGERLTQQGALAGTPAYMSPEQAEGVEDLDARSDLYSVGALAYFLLTARPPFADRSTVKMLAAHLYETPRPLTAHCPDVPADLEAVVLHCLAKDRAARFPDAESLDAALAECGDNGRWSAKEARAWWGGSGRGGGAAQKEDGHV